MTSFLSVFIVSTCVIWVPEGHTVGVWGRKVIEAAVWDQTQQLEVYEQYAFIFKTWCSSQKGEISAHLQTENYEVLNWGFGILSFDVDVWSRKGFGFKGWLLFTWRVIGQFIFGYIELNCTVILSSLWTTFSSLDFRQSWFWLLIVAQDSL